MNDGFGGLPAPIISIGEAAGEVRSDAVGVVLPESVAVALCCDAADRRLYRIFCHSRCTCAAAEAVAKGAAWSFCAYPLGGERGTSSDDTDAVALELRRREAL